MFALQQLLLPRDYWIFYHSSKPYFTVCSSRAAAGTHWSLWYWATNQMHREADAGRLTVRFNILLLAFPISRAISETECWLLAILILTWHWSSLIFIDGTLITRWGEETRMFFWSAQGRLHVPWMAIKRIWWLESSSLAACFVSSSSSFKSGLLEVLLAQIKVDLPQGCKK